MCGMTGWWCGMRRTTMQWDWDIYDMQMRICERKEKKDRLRASRPWKMRPWRLASRSVICDDSIEDATRCDEGIVERGEDEDEEGVVQVLLLCFCVALRIRISNAMRCDAMRACGS
jgi:hypothetical protein